MNWEDVKIGQWCLFSYEMGKCLAVAQIDDLCYEEEELRMVVISAEIWSSNGNPDSEAFMFNPYTMKPLKTFDEFPKEFLL